MKKRLFVICPGRGSYTKESLGYLKNITGSFRQIVDDFDERRRELNYPTISELDNSKTFKTNVHTKGEHASPLIYTCSAWDYHQINKEDFEVVAIAGNSMGWYLTLAMSQALDYRSAYTLIQTMGSMMKDKLIGGQVIYPIVDDQWHVDATKKALVFQLTNTLNQQPDTQCFLSIELGGYLVIAGNDLAIKKLLKELPSDGDFPFQLINHGAFHTPLLKDVSEKAFNTINAEIFHQPKVPIIDGRGHIWHPYSTDVLDLYEYTLGHQVTEPYDFTASVITGLKEFAPDHIVLLGPGNSLGGSIGQILVQTKWHGITSKSDFSIQQKEHPFLISMGDSQQKKLVV
ncbi:MAG: ACP S-malonyltransferase [Bdellovibrionales bacterium]|nr:ACP S-malonyltransferase [Bdellovibrionales bacterium]